MIVLVIKEFIIMLEILALIHHIIIIMKQSQCIGVHLGIIANALELGHARQLAGAKIATLYKIICLNISNQ